MPRLEVPPADGLTPRRLIWRERRVRRWLLLGHDLPLEQKREADMPLAT